MTKTQKKRAEAWERIRGAIRDCGPEGSATLELREVDSQASASGRTHYIEARVWRIGDDGRPCSSEWLTWNLCQAMGLRFNERRQALGMGGYGYSREQHIADWIVRQAGHPIRVECPGSFAGPKGWYPARDWQPKARAS